MTENLAGRSRRFRAAEVRPPHDRLSSRPILDANVTTCPIASYSRGREPGSTNPRSAVAAPVATAHGVGQLAAPGHTTLAETRGADRRRGGKRVVVNLDQHRKNKTPQTASQSLEKIAKTERVSKSGEWLARPASAARACESRCRGRRAVGPHRQRSPALARWPDRRPLCGLQ